MLSEFNFIFQQRNNFTIFFFRYFTGGDEIRHFLNVIFPIPLGRVDIKLIVDRSTIYSAECVLGSKPYRQLYVLPHEDIEDKLRVVERTPHPPSPPGGKLSTTSSRKCLKLKLYDPSPARELNPHSSIASKRLQGK